MSDVDGSLACRLPHRTIRLEFSQNAVQSPVDRRGRDAGTLADTNALQMFDDVLDNRELNIRGIRHCNALFTIERMETDGLIVED